MTLWTGSVHACGIESAKPWGKQERASRKLGTRYDWEGTRGFPGEVTLLLAPEEEGADTDRQGAWAGRCLPPPSRVWELQGLWPPDRSFPDAGIRRSGSFQIHREPLGRFEYEVRGSDGLIYWLLKTTPDIRKIKNLPQPLSRQAH